MARDIPRCDMAALEKGDDGVFRVVCQKARIIEDGGKPSVVFSQSPCRENCEKFSGFQHNAR